MKREGLLTKLAMGLPEWPDGEVRNPPKAFGEFRKYPFGNNEWSLLIQGELFTQECWLDKRRRLINKPSWDDAPEGAQWLAQDSNGDWYWYKTKPARILGVWAGRVVKLRPTAVGAIPAGHDWRATLEQRPTDLTLTKGEGMTSTKSTAEKIKVMQAYLSGETLEATTDGLSSWVEWGG